MRQAIGDGLLATACLLWAGCMIAVTARAGSPIVDAVASGVAATWAGAAFTLFGAAANLVVAAVALAIARDQRRAVIEDRAQVLRERILNLLEVVELGTFQVRNDSLMLEAQAKSMALAGVAVWRLGLTIHGLKRVRATLSNCGVEGLPSVLSLHKVEVEQLLESTIDVLVRADGKQDDRLLFDLSGLRHHCEATRSMSRHYARGFIPPDHALHRALADG